VWVAKPLRPYLLSYAAMIKIDSRIRCLVLCNCRGPTEEKQKTWTDRETNKKHPWTDRHTCAFVWAHAQVHTSIYRWMHSCKAGELR
jgi:hypothetical protein